MPTDHDHVQELARELATIIHGPERGDDVTTELARRLVGLIDSAVTERLQSLGGAMLTTHGAGGPRPDEYLASVGGYLLGRDHTELLAELRDEAYPAADPKAQQ
jgi:hypothetical protein